MFVVPPQISDYIVTTPTNRLISLKKLSVRENLFLILERDNPNIFNENNYQFKQESPGFELRQPLSHIKLTNGRIITLKPSDVVYYSLTGISLPFILIDLNKY